MKQPNPTIVSPLQHQREHPGEDLRSCGKAETKSLTLDDFPIQGYMKVWSKIRMDRNLEVGRHHWEYGEHVPLPDGSQDWEYSLHHEFGEGDIPIEDQQIDNWPPPSWCLLN